MAEKSGFEVTLLLSAETKLARYERFPSLAKICDGSRIIYYIIYWIWASQRTQDKKTRPRYAKLFV